MIDKLDKLRKILDKIEIEITAVNPDMKRLNKNVDKFCKHWTLFKLFVLTDNDKLSDGF